MPNEGTRTERHISVAGVLTVSTEGDPVFAGPDEVIWADKTGSNPPSVQNTAVWTRAQALEAVHTNCRTLCTAMAVVVYNACASWANGVGYLDVNVSRSFDLNISLVL